MANMLSIATQTDSGRNSKGDLLSANALLKLNIALKHLFKNMAALEADKQLYSKLIYCTSPLYSNSLY